MPHWHQMEPYSKARIDYSQAFCFHTRTEDTEPKPGDGTRMDFYVR